MEKITLKIKPCPACVEFLDGAFMEYCPDCTKKKMALERRLEKGETLTPILDGFELFVREEPRISTEEDHRSDILEALRDDKTNRLRVSGKRFYLEGVICTNCGAQIFVDTEDIHFYADGSLDDGFFWYCDKCGSVDVDGKPLEGDANEYWLGPPCK